MANEFLLPDIREGLAEAEIVSWLVAPGDQEADGQPPCEVETAKAVVELPSPFAGVLQPAQLQGATFTVSNIGALGGGHGSPIIPLGTTAIVSFGRAGDTPVVRDGKVEIAPMMPISLSYDHRVIDGALGRRFITTLTDHLNDRATYTDA